MDDVLCILKAYETLRSHGLEIPLRSGSQANRKEVVTGSESESILIGNTTKQLGFLGTLLSRAGILNSAPELTDRNDGHSDPQSTDGHNDEITERTEANESHDHVAGEADGRLNNPIRVSSLLASGRSFKQALMTETDQLRQQNDGNNGAQKPLAVPRYEGGNIVIDLDEDDYNKGIDELQFSIVGRLFLSKGSSAPTTMALRSKLAAVWGTESFKLIPMGGGLHHVLLQSMEEQSRVMSHGPINVSPGIFRIARWTPGFDPACLRTTTQIWVKLYGIPLEFRKGQNLLNIAAAIGTPLRLDQGTIDLYQGLYARVLIDTDVSKRLPERILASLKVPNRNINVNFFVSVKYEQIPKFCNVCRALGHSELDCRRSNGMQHFQRKDMITERTRVQEQNKDFRREVSSRNNGRNSEKEGTNKGAIEEGEKSQQGEGTNIEQHEKVDTDEGITPPSHVITSVGREVPNDENGQHIQHAATSSCREGQNASPTPHGVTSPDREGLNTSPTHLAVILPDSEGQQVSILPNREDQNTPKSSKGVSKYKSRWEPVSLALREYADTGIINTSNSFNVLNGNMDLEKLSRLFPEDVDSAMRASVRQELVRKEMDWERTKKRLEQRMEADMVARRTVEEMGKQSIVEGEKSVSNKSSNWIDLPESEEEQDDTPCKNDRVDTRETTMPETQVQKPPLDPDKIYWDNNTEIFIHASGMCYDPNPGAKVYYTIIDQEGGDLRPLYYVQSGGDFSLARKGKLGQSNKVVLEDKGWDKGAIYSVKSPNYKPGLLKMFKEKIKEGVN